MAAHAGAVERAIENECRIVRREGRDRREDGENKHARDQRPAAPEAIGQRAENKCADGPCCERDGDAPDNSGFADLKFLGKGIDDKGENEECECIEYPTEDSRGDGESPARRISGMRSCGVRLTFDCNGGLSVRQTVQIVR